MKFSVEKQKFVKSQLGKVSIVLVIYTLMYTNLDSTFPLVAFVSAMVSSFIIALVLAKEKYLTIEGFYGDRNETKATANAVKAFGMLSVSVVLFIIFMLSVIPFLDSELKYVMIKIATCFMFSSIVAFSVPLINKIKANTRLLFTVVVFEFVLLLTVTVSLLFRL